MAKKTSKKSTKKTGTKKTARKSSGRKPGTRNTTRSWANTGAAGGTPIRILSIDGGGILGLTTVISLRELERRLGSPLREHFDVVAGTSTGSILAVAVAAGIDLERVERLYHDRGPDIFRGGVLDSFGRVFTQGVSRPRYGDAGLRDALREELCIDGEPITFGDLDPRRGGGAPLTMVTAYETITRKAWIFKSNREYLEHVEAWEIVKGSSSAPTYFPGHVVSLTVPRRPGSAEMRHRRFSLIDGGVFANNPAACALAEAAREQRADGGLFADRPAAFVVASFGNIRNADDPISGDEAEEWGALEWVNPKRGVPILGVMMDGSLETTQYICESLVPTGSFSRFELEVDAREDHKMDDASEKHLAELTALANAYLSQDGVQAEMDALKRRLLGEG